MPCLGIVGTFVWDRIFPPPDGDRAGEAPTEDWGGITYSLESFETARPDDWTFLPIAKVGADVHDDVLSRIGTLAGVRGARGLVKVPEPNNRVDLHYHDRGDRCERLSGGVPGWTWSELAPLAAECDAMYVNFIAGWELDLDAARGLRRRFDGPLYCDIHSLLLGVDASGVRVRRALPEWPQWAECFDWVQGNEAEIGIVTGAGNPAAAVRRLVEGGVEAAFCTLGPSGAVWASRGAQGRSEAPRAGRGVVDPTGCGDVWGAACVAGLLAGAPIPAAVDRANWFGAVTAGYRGTAGLSRVLAGRVPAPPSSGTDAAAKAAEAARSGGG